MSDSDDGVLVLVTPEQASASDILGKDRYAGRIVRNFDVREIAEATALTLMEDMMVGLP